MPSNQTMLPPCVVAEDEHFLVVNKPPGWNTHSPAPFAGEGIYEWLKNREPRWKDLAIIHRLDKETSGLLVFSKTTLANRALTLQFERRQVKKQYLLASTRQLPEARLEVRSRIAREGSRYVAAKSKGDDAETHFERAGQLDQYWLARSRPLTGRTHQIRVHAAEAGCPILGDVLYGGAEAPRVYLHAEQIQFEHPVTGERLQFTAPQRFSHHPADELRRALIEPSHTDACRLRHGAAEKKAAYFVDRYGPVLLAQSAQHPADQELSELVKMAGDWGVSSIFHKRWSAGVQRQSIEESSPELLWGDPARGPFHALENGLRYEIRLNEGYSVGLFLDQRDNHRRILHNHIAAEFPLFDDPQGKELLNTFAYTCSFSVCAAAAGLVTTSLDLSRKYLDWGKRNFDLNGLPLDGHDFIYGDTFDWLKRFRKKGRKFDFIILDPPTFSRSKTGIFRSEKDYRGLIELALPLLRSGGILLASTNTASIEPPAFINMARSAAQTLGREILREQYYPQPPDFPISREEPGYLRTFWARLS